MKQGMITILILLVFAWVVMFPKKPVVAHVDTEPSKLPVFVVTIEGEIHMPSSLTYVYPVTLSEVIEDAYGLTDHADLSSMNLTATIHQTQTIVIPRIREERQIDQPLLSINHASFKELIEIPGITETKAASIIIYREANGPFTSLDELINVKYIGTVTLEKIKPYLKLG